jgi:DsbC/DsbD-like thiol-disulfide interchange protein
MRLLYVNLPTRRHDNGVCSHDHVSSARGRLPLDNGMARCSPGRFAILPLALLCLSSLSPAAAQDATAWQHEAHAATRLIAGSPQKTPDGSILRAGIEIRLDPGWKTYWRYPGDTGVPPTFDFAGSQNVKSTTVQWPAPESFSDGAGGHSIGYVGDVILPLTVTPADPAQPATLHVKLNYAICGTLCVPAEAALAISLTGKGADDAAMNTAEQRVPKRVALGRQSGNALAILAVHRVGGGAHDEVVVDVAAPAGAPVALYAEGPTPDWALPLPEPAGPATAPKRRFTFALDGLPPGATAKGAAIMLTAVSGGNAIEVSTHLD